jgi:hypothetical protein
LGNIVLYDHAPEVRVSRWGSIHHECFHAGHEYAAIADDQNQVRRRVPFRDYGCKLGLPHYPGRRIGAMRLGALPLEQQQKLALIKGASFVGANASVWKRTHALPRRPEYCF